MSLNQHKLKFWIVIYSGKHPYSKDLPCLLFSDLLLSSHCDVVLVPVSVILCYYTHPFTFAYSCMCMWGKYCTSVCILNFSNYVSFDGSERMRWKGLGDVDVLESLLFALWGRGGCGCRAGFLWSADVQDKNQVKALIKQLVPTSGSLHLLFPMSRLLGLGHPQEPFRQTSGACFNAFFLKGAFLSKIPKFLWVPTVFCPSAGVCIAQLHPSVLLCLFMEN